MNCGLETKPAPSLCSFVGKQKRQRKDLKNFVMILCLVFIYKRISMCYPLSSLAIGTGAPAGGRRLPTCGAVVDLGYHHMFCCFQLSSFSPDFPLCSMSQFSPFPYPPACLRDDLCMSSAAITMWCKMWPTLGVFCRRGKWFHTMELTPSEESSGSVFARSMSSSLFFCVHTRLTDFSSDALIGHHCSHCGA